MTDTEKSNLSNLEKISNQEEINKIETPGNNLNELNSNNKEDKNENNIEIKSNSELKEKESQNEVNEEEERIEKNEYLESDGEEKNIIENKEEKKEISSNQNKKISTEDLIYDEEPQIEHLTINEQEQIILKKESNRTPVKENNNNNNQNNKINKSKNNNKREEENNQIINNNKNKNTFKELSPLETSEIESNLNRLYTQVFNVSKNTITNNNVSDTEQLKLDFVKESSKLQPNKNDNFMMRMTFDIMKRQTQGKRLENIIEKTKNKMDENQRIKGFNRLIEDANRRLEAQEQLNTLKKKLEEKEEEKPLKKYKQNEWENIYNERFKLLQIKYEENMKSKIEKKNEEKKIEEENEIKMCKVIKKPMKNIIDYANKMYEEAKKRNTIKENKIHYDKYVKDINKNNQKNTNSNQIQKQTIISLSKNNKLKNPNLNNQINTQNKILNKTNPKKKGKNEFQISLENIKVNNEKRNSSNNEQNNFENKEIMKENYNQVNKTARVRMGKIENPNKNNKKNMAIKIVDEFFLNNLYH